MGSPAGCVHTKWSPVGCIHSEVEQRDIIGSVPEGSPVGCVHSEVEPIEV